MKPDSSSRGMGLVALLCALAGIDHGGGDLAFGRVALPSERLASSPASIGATEEYGKRLISQTSEYLGPDVADPKMRFMNSRLACASCHIGAGVEPGNLSLATAFNKYPRISPRSGANETIEDRINGCMMRSMNGRALAENSPEMIAMVSYLRFLADQDAATSLAGVRRTNRRHSRRRIARPTSRRAKEVFGKRCAACHGQDGAGLAAAPDPVHGFVFPPLWGPNSFNDGAGMHRVLTAARFIKARMPLGNAGPHRRGSIRCRGLHQFKTPAGNEADWQATIRTRPRSQSIPVMVPTRTLSRFSNISFGPFPAHRSVLQERKASVEVAV